jgi:hypothetical protein
VFHVSAEKAVNERLAYMPALDLAPAQFAIAADTEVVSSMSCITRCAWETSIHGASLESAKRLGASTNIRMLCSLLSVSRALAVAKADVLLRSELRALRFLSCHILFHVSRHAFCGANMLYPSRCAPFPSYVAYFPTSTFYTHTTSPSTSSTTAHAIRSPLFADAHHSRVFAPTFALS